MNMGHPGGPMYGMNNNNSQRRPAPYPTPNMYMQSKRLQQPSAFPSSGMSGMNMSGSSGPGNMPGNGFPGGMRGGMSGQFPPSGHPLGNSGNTCPPGSSGAPNTSVTCADMGCGPGQSQGPNSQHLSGGMGSQMTNFQGCSSNSMTGSRGSGGGVQGNSFMSNGGFHNEYMGSHGQVGSFRIQYL